MTAFSGSKQCRSNEVNVASSCNARSLLKTNTPVVPGRLDDCSVAPTSVDAEGAEGAYRIAVVRDASFR